MSRSVLLVALVVVVAAVTSLNHYTTQENLRYFTDVQQRDIRELARMKATEDAQIMATEALIMGRIQAGQVTRLTNQLTHAENVALDMIKLVHEQNSYIEVLVDTLAKNGITPPAPGAKGEEKVEEKPLVAASFGGLPG